MGAGIYQLNPLYRASKVTDRARSVFVSAAIRKNKNLNERRGYHASDPYLA